MPARSLLALSALLASLAPAWCDTITVGGAARTFILQAPATRPAPLVIALHGNTQTGEDMVRRTSWPAVARRENFAVVFPDGLNRAWTDLRPGSERGGRVPPKGTDDAAFLVALTQKLIGDGIADPRRIYVTGVSNGGAMAMTLVCQHADLFAASASVIFNMTDAFASKCRPARGIPMLMMNGTADPLIPFEGGRGTSRFAVGGFWSTAQTLAFWQKQNGCATQDQRSVELPDRDRSDRSNVTRIETRCPAGHEVLLYRINGGGHRMPGAFPDAIADRAVTSFLGPQNHDIDGAETIWAFLKGFSRSGR